MTVITPCMFDIYHGTSLDAPNYAGDEALFAKAKAAGWVFMDHKLTQGTDFVDSLVMGRMPYAAKAGLMLGVYHFVTGDNPIAQALYFLKALTQLRALIPGVPLVITVDNEPDPSSTVTDAIADMIVYTIKQATGKWPLLYGNRYNVYNESLTTYLGACQYWLAEYGPNQISPVGWSNFPSVRTPLHQYSDGTLNNPVNIPGIGWVDQSTYAGAPTDFPTWFTGAAV